MTHAIARAAIRTRYHGPTNYRGARISASRDGHMVKPERIYIDYPHELDSAAGHALAAQTFLDKFIDPLLGKATVCADAGLCFEGDYYWTWELNR